MANDKPLTPTFSTFNQMGQAVAALVWFLGDDPRVQEAYTAWRGRLRGETVADLKRSIVTNKADDLHELERLVRDDLGLEYRWLPALLLTDFGVTLGAELSGLPRVPLRVTPEPQTDMEPGRRAKNDGQPIVRDVEWFYRCRVKVPSDTEYALAKEDQERKRDAGVTIGVNPNVPRAGVRRAEQLLAAVDLADAI